MRILFRQIFRPKKSRPHYEDLVPELVHLAMNEPPEKELKKIVSSYSDDPISDYTNYRVTFDQLAFNFSIANEVINIWLINRFFTVPDIAKIVIDHLSLAFAYAQDQRKSVSIGTYIANEDELCQIRAFIEPGSDDSVSNTKEIGTTLWTLMDIVYLKRQEVYYNAIRKADEEIKTNQRKQNDLMNDIAFELVAHLHSSTPNETWNSVNNTIYGCLLATTTNLLGAYCRLAFEIIMHAFDNHHK